MPETTTWTVENSASLYGVDSWGAGYVGVNGRGHVEMGAGDRRVDLHELVNGLRARGIPTPMVIRFRDVLEDRMTVIANAFARAIEENEYQGTYSAVYPIKVNQQRQICAEIRDKAVDLRFGFEAGSKPELLAVLGLVAELPADVERPLVVCNGFKDDEYIETVVLASKLGLRIVTVIERPKELDALLRYASSYGIRPMIGVRIKPSSRGAGRWEASGGMRSKFGLNFTELLRMVERLKRDGMLDCLQVLHFHVGSQICDIRRFKNAIGELAHTFQELTRLGAGLKMINVGGGLGVDYDGSQSATDSSVNYSVDEYAADIVWRIRSACDEAGIPHPTILSESGRAMVAHSSVLVMDVLGLSRFPSNPELDAIEAAMEQEEDVPDPVHELIDAYRRLSTGADLTELFHDASQAREDAISLYGLGYMSLPLRAACERLFWAIGKRMLGADEEIEGEESLSLLLSDLCYCNFSLFQSLPDSWAIDQIFPVCPLHRLDEEPTRRTRIVDMTCDSDGQITRYSQHGEESSTILLHEPREGEHYDLGIFITGAYQEVLGDLHNLFGDTNVVHVSLDESGWVIDEIIEGDRVEEVLGYLQYDVKGLSRAMRAEVERAVRTGTLDVEEGRAFMTFYEQGLAGYTYLE